jgi:hypothetical protein
MFLQDGSTPLHLAAQEGHTGVVALLLEHKANLETADKVEKFEFIIMSVSGLGAFIVRRVSQDMIYCTIRVYLLLLRMGTRRFIWQ